MPTTEAKADQFIKAMDEAVAAALNRLKIEHADVNVRVEVDVQSVKRADIPK